MNRTVISILGSIALALVIFFWGHSTGSDKVQRQWDKTKATQMSESLRVQMENAKLLQAFAEYVDKSRKTRLEKEHEYKEALNSINDTYNDSLRDSEERAAFYRQQAEHNSSNCRGLADYAGRLDRTIVEGQRLVRELVKTLEKRNVDVKFVGGVLIQEQKLLSNGD